MRLGRPLPWVLDEDPKSAYHLKPVVDVEGIAPPWRQVIGTVRQVQSGTDPARLRSVVEHSLAQLPVSGTRRVPQQAVDLVEVTRSRRVGAGRCPSPRTSTPASALAAYADLEDALARVDGVTAAVMEDRDRALLSTGEGIDRADLERRLTRAVDALLRPVGGDSGGRRIQADTTAIHASPATYAAACQPDQSSASPYRSRAIASSTTNAAPVSPTGPHRLRGRRPAGRGRRPSRARPARRRWRGR